MNEYQINYNFDTFLKRLDKELFNNYEVYIFLENILKDFYLIDMEDSIFYNDFYNQLISEGTVDIKIIRQIIRTSEFYIFFKDFMNNKVEDLISKLTFVDNKIKIYRAITCNYDFINRVKFVNKISLGIFWSYCYEGAIPYNGCPSENEYIFFAEININNIDWFHTLILNTCEIYGEDEQEIRTFSNKKVYNFSIEKVGELLHYTVKKNVKT